MAAGTEEGRAAGVKEIRRCGGAIRAAAADDLPTATGEPRHGEEGHPLYGECGREACSVDAGRPRPGRQDRRGQHHGSVFPQPRRHPPHLGHGPADHLARAGELPPGCGDPSLGGLADLAQWLEQKINEQALSIRAGRPFDALLGVGGGDLLVKKLAEEVRLVRTLERMGIRPVAMHVVGPDNADLDYLAQVVADELFLPAATLIVLNGGLVADGRSVANAFTPILNHPALVAAMGKGAKVVRFPELSPMRQVSEGKLLFEDAAAGKAPEAGEPLSFFDQERVSIWWEEKVPAFFGGINPLWMPALPHQAEAAA